MGSTYIINPLKYTPKYQLIYELDNSKTLKIIDDPNTEKLSPQDVEKATLYRAFISNLPKNDKNKKVLGDI